MLLNGFSLEKVVEPDRDRDTVFKPLTVFCFQDQCFFFICLTSAGKLCLFHTKIQQSIARKARMEF